MDRLPGGAEMIHEFYVNRDDKQPTFTRGELTLDGEHWSYTCEDTVRPPGEKIYGKTAIPSGRYRLGMRPSNHFGRMVVQILNVPQFDLIYFHGGNDADDSLGCILHGRVRTDVGCRDCKEPVAALEKFVSEAIANGDECWVTVE